ncbi:MAG: BMP family ABC transporter substrate-binding protein, partial [Ilumatobacteraceae bacterium]
KVCFEMETGYKFGPNLSEAYGAGEDGDYLAGMAAGAASKTGKIGFLAPFAIPEVIRGINAFTLGARAINPAATVQVVWTNTWFDPTKERQAAESLISAGADAICSAQDSPAAGEAAKVKNIPWVGYDSDQNANFPEIWLTATTYHWGVYEVPRIGQILAGTWVPGDYYGNLKDGMVKLATFGKIVTAETQAKIKEKEAALAEAPGSQFTGPIKAQDGTVKIAKGATASYGDLMSMSYLVEGVIGDIPKS